MTKPQLSMSRAEVDALLSLPVTGTLTTLGLDGWPHSAGMWFFREGDEMLMWTYAKSQKARNLDRDQRASFLIEHGEPYKDLRGVLVRSSARLISSEEEITEIGRSVYDRYLFSQTVVPYEQGPNVEVERQAAKRIGIALPLDRVTSWDHSKA
jgi:nitroimidazol reductase NimA-like FMN-containing flavoprotein (pyridoxamine 5'-phosphate oxidase superfamily)